MIFTELLLIPSLTDRMEVFVMGSLDKVYSDYIGKGFKSQSDFERVFESFSQSLKRALEKDCSISGLEVLKFSCENFKIEMLIRNPETDAIAYASILGLRGGFCLPLNNVSYKREDAMDFPRGGFWCQCAPLPELIERVKSLTEH